MDSKVIDTVVNSTKFESKEANKDFPISFMDFLNFKATEHISHNTSSKGRSKGLMVESCLATDEVEVHSSIISPSTENSESENATLSDEEYLPTYKNLFERIKRQSSDDNLFKPKFSPDRQEEKVTNASFSDNGTPPTGKSTISSEDSLEEKKIDICASPIKLKSSSIADATQSAVEIVSMTITDSQPANVTNEHLGDKDKPSIAKQLIYNNNDVGLNTKIESRKGKYEGFPTTLLGFINLKEAELTTPKTFCNGDQSKDLIVENCLATEEVQVHSLIISPSTENSEPENATLSDEEYLPTYKSLFERIKRQSSGDNFFNREEKITNTSLSNNDTSSTGKSSNPSNCDYSLEEKIKKADVGVCPTKLKSSNTTDSAQPVLQTVSSSSTLAENQPINMMHEDLDDKNKLSITKQLIKLPVEQPAYHVATDVNHDVKTEQDSSDTDSEAFPVMDLSYIERFCYKAMVFQQTGEVPVDCDFGTAEKCCSDDGLGPKPKNPHPCLCRFYEKKKCKDKVVKSPSYKGPCRLGKGFASDKKNSGHSSCASCKVLPIGKAGNKLLRRKIGESSNTKPAATYNAVAIEHEGIVKSQKRKRVGRRLVEKPNPDQDGARKYLDDLASKTKLFAKLEMTEKRLKHLANYDSNLSLVSDNMVPLVEDRDQYARLLSTLDDESPEEQKENLLFPPLISNLDPCIDLTSDSPPRSPYQFNRTRSVKAKEDPDDKHLSVPKTKRQKQTFGRYGAAAKGAIYVSDSSDEGDFGPSMVENKDKNVKSSVQPMRYQNPRFSYITDSDEERPVKPNLQSKISATVTSQPIESKTVKLETNFSSRLENWRRFLDGVPTPSVPPSSLVTEPNRAIPIEQPNWSQFLRNDSHLDKKERDASIPKPQSFDLTNGGLCNPVASGSKESVPETHSSSYVIPKFDDFFSLSSEDENPSRVTYSDLLASYACYESDDDDRVSIVMGSPGSPYNDDLFLTTNDAGVQETPQLVMDEVVTVSKPPTSNVRRVLRTRTTPRITQSMMTTRRTVKKEPICPTESRIPVPVNSASVPDLAGLSVSVSVGLPTRRARGRPRKNPLQQSHTPDPVKKKVKGVVANESVGTDSDDKSTPENVKLKREMSKMQSRLEKVSALASRAAQLEREAMAAKEKELLAVQEAREARAARDQLLAEAKRDEKARLEKAAKEKEKALSQAQKKAWECPVCFEPKSASTQLAVTPCGHMFCKPCILQVGRARPAHCPLCNQVFLVAHVTPLFLDL